MCQSEPVERESTLISREGRANSWQIFSCETEMCRDLFKTHVRRKHARTFKILHHSRRTLERFASA